MQDIIKAVDLIRDYLQDEGESENKYFTGGVSCDKVRQAERALEVEFPESYVSFLKLYGSGGIGCADFFGIENETVEIEKYTVVNITFLFREKYKLPKYLVVIENCGDYIVCLNTRGMKNSECPVMSYGLYDNGEVILCADNFYQYLLEKLDDALN